MLGEKFYESMGKITGVRVIPGDEHSPAVESSFQGQGTIYGIPTTDIGTYVSRLQDNGVFHGEGQGIAMTKDGDSIAWKGFGIGKPTGKGLGMSYRYSISYQTSSQKLAKLNSLVCVGEWEVDENGNTKGTGWEWK
jgi:hypothetical protein